MKKMMMISLLIMIMVISCKDDPTSPVIKPLNTDELIPLKIGNTWVHEYIGYDGSKEMKIKGTTMVDSEIQYENAKHYLFKFTYQGTGETETPQVYYINKSDAFYMIILEDMEEPEIIRLNYPTFEGDIISEDENGKFFVEKVDEFFTTPAGKFKCIKYINISMYDGEEYSRNISYIAPGIGIIATERYHTNQNSGLQILEEKSILQSYQLK
jgi:hypothetical protein